MFRLIFFMFGSIGTVVTAAVVAGAILTVTGTPDACRNSTVEAVLNGAPTADQKWEKFRSEISAKGEARVTLTEQEVTGRANKWVDDKKLPVEELKIFLCAPDDAHPKGQVQMTASIGAGPATTKVLVDISLDTSGRDTRIKINEVRAGNLPGFATGWADGRVEDLVDEATVTFEEQIIAVSIIDGSVTLAGKK